MRGVINADDIHDDVVLKNTALTLLVTYKILLLASSVTRMNRRLTSSRKLTRRIVFTMALCARSSPAAATTCEVKSVCIFSLVSRLRMDNRIAFKIPKDNDAECEVNPFFLKHRYHPIELSADCTDIIYHTPTNVKQKNEINSGFDSAVSGHSPRCLPMPLPSVSSLSIGGAGLLLSVAVFSAVSP